MSKNRSTEKKFDSDNTSAIEKSDEEEKGDSS